MRSVQLSQDLEKDLNIGKSNFAVLLGFLLEVFSSLEKRQNVDPHDFKDLLLRHGFFYNCDLSRFMACKCSYAYHHDKCSNQF